MASKIKVGAESVVHFVERLNDSSSWSDLTLCSRDATWLKKTGKRNRVTCKTCIKRLGKERYENVIAKTGPIGKVKVVCEFTISSLATWEDLRDMEFDTLLDFVRFEVEEEGLFGIVDDPVGSWAECVVSAEEIE